MVIVYLLLKKFILYFGILKISNLVTMIPHRSYRSDGVPSSSISLPSSSSRSLYMGSRPCPVGMQGSSSIPPVTPELQRSGASSFVPHSNFGCQPNMALHTGMPQFPVSSIASPPIQVPTVPSNYYYSSPSQNAYTYGPPYFRDPFLASNPSCSPFPLVPSNPTASTLPPQYFTPRVTSPVPEDDSSTIVTNGVSGVVPQDIMFQGCQVSFQQNSSVPQVSAGCQVSSFSASSRSSSPSDHTKEHLLVRDKTKFTLPTFDNSKMEWSDYATKIRAALCKCNMSYLLSEPATNSVNAKHSKELCLELYDKLTGASLQLFKSLAAQDYYMEGGRGIEMIHLLAATFNPMDSNKRRTLLLKLISATLPEDMELLEFINVLKDTNMQLSWCGTGMPEDLLVDIAMHRLESSRYKRDVDQLLISHTATGSSYNTLDALYDALIRLDRYRGLAYGSKKTPGSENKDKRFTGGKFKGTNQGLVSAVTDHDAEDGSSTFTFHKDAWIGAIELEEKHVKHLRHIFRCPLCRTNKHNFPQCPILSRTFSITKLPVDDKKGSASSVVAEEKPGSVSSGNNLGQASSVTVPPLHSSDSSVVDEDIVDDFQSMVL